MKTEIMICGIDCNPNDGYCNNYCNHDTSKPMPDSPPDAPKEIVYERLIKRAELASSKADAAVEELRLAHNELFAEGIARGFKALVESCKRRREKLNILTGKKTD